MTIILDSAVFINASSFPFSASNTYVIPSACVGELKELSSKMRFEAAKTQFSLSIVDPSPFFLRAANASARAHGVKRLSSADLSVLALAMECVSERDRVKVFTDDYAVQNLLKWEKIPFSGVLQKGITKKRSFSKQAR